MNKIICSVLSIVLFFGSFTSVVLFDKPLLAKNNANVYGDRAGAGGINKGSVSSFKKTINTIKNKLTHIYNVIIEKIMRVLREIIRFIYDPIGYMKGSPNKTLRRGESLKDKGLVD